MPNPGFLTTTKVIKHIVTSPTEAEVVAIFHTIQALKPLKTIIEKLGHPQEKIIIFTDNNVSKQLSMQECSSIKTRTMLMKYRYTQEQVKQNKMIIQWAPGISNQADYFTKIFDPVHHKKWRQQYILN